jgi:hypothetical protein
MTRGLVRNEPLAQRERAVEYPSDSDYCALFQGAEEPRSRGAKKPEVRSTAFFCGASTGLPASDFLSPISWLLGSSQGDSHFASILVVESREMRVDLLCRCFDRLRNALKTRWL